DASAHLTESLIQLETVKKTTWSAQEVASTRAKWRAEIDAERPGILPVADALKEAVPVDTMFFSDMTQFAYAAKEVYPMDRPGHWHHPYGFGTLGYALPAAIGGKIGVGDQPVIAILGDYGFQYTVQELAVAVELELTLPIIIWDNGKLGEIEDSMVRAQIAPNAVVQRNPDFLKLAQAYGAVAVEPANLEQFKSAVQRALHAKGPTIIRVTSDIALTSS
ncbi:thiamine pyrophosphate-dependent enzyme, partial [Yoonia sp.]|uniref:thiamine pyrophosphate-dependent enzyme n=1 Tax=Yoonia sp. TaxID=2212373 RepID=UPI0039747122